jgi:hypothetical protein
MSGKSPILRRNHERIHTGRRRQLCLGRPVPDRRPADRGRAHGARRRRSLCRRQARAAHRGGLSRREDRSGDLPRNGRGRPARHHRSRGIWRPWRRLRHLWSRRPRGRARRFRLSLDDVGAVVAGDVPDLCLWLGGAAQEVPAQACFGRVDRLLRPDRAGRGFRPGRHEDPRREDRQWLQDFRLEDVDLERADRRRLRRLGQVCSP